MDSDIIFVKEVSRAPRKQSKLKNDQKIKIEKPRPLTPKIESPVKDFGIVSPSRKFTRRSSSLNSAPVPQKLNISADIFASDDEVVAEDPNLTASKARDYVDDDNEMSRDIFASDDDEIQPSISKQEKENFVEDFDSIEIISPPKKGPKPSFIPRDPNKPKVDLSQFLEKDEPRQKEKRLKLTPVRKQVAKEETMKTVDGYYQKPVTSAKTKSTSKQTKIDSHLKPTADIKPNASIFRSKQTKIDPHLKPTADKKIAASSIRSKTPPPLRTRNVTPSLQMKRKNDEIVTPPSKKFTRRSSSLTNSPLSGELAAQLKALLESPNFLARKKSAFTDVLEKAKKHAADNPKCKFSRTLMNGYECACCKSHYDAMGLEGEERRAFVNKVSKHRGFQQAPPTPPRYWDLDVPSREEQIELGYVIETDSPLFKPKKKRRI